MSEEIHFLEDGFYVNELEQEIERLQQRIDKAIEYIKDNRDIYYPDEPLSEPDVYYDNLDIEVLLNILQGSDKNE